MGETTTLLEAIKERGEKSESIEGQVMGDDIPKVEWGPFVKGYKRNPINYFRRTEQVEPEEPVLGKSKTEHLRAHKFEVLYPGTYEKNFFSAYLLYRKNMFDYSRFEDGWTQEDESKLFWKEQFGFSTVPRLVKWVKNYFRKNESN